MGSALDNGGILSREEFLGEGLGGRCAMLVASSEVGASDLRRLISRMWRKIDMGLLSKMKNFA